MAKDNLVCCLSMIDQEQSIQVISQASFPNNVKGFEDLMRWTSEQGLDQANIPCWFVLEATGVYYENLAFFLFEHSLSLSVLLPIRANYFAKSLEVKTKTDKVDAQILAQIGLERKLEPWQAPSQFTLEIKQLCREYRTNKIKINRLKNRLHAKEHSYRPMTSILRRLKSEIRHAELASKEIEVEILDLIESDEYLAEGIYCMTSIPGISQITAACLVAETNGFALIRNSKQLVSYAGLDVVHSQSGNKQGKSRISKRGNAFIRLALYMPALCALKHNPLMKTFYQRVIEGKPSKLVGVAAVSRKMLVLCYTLWKNREVFRAAA